MLSFASLPADALDPGGSWTTSVLPGVVAVVLAAVATRRGYDDCGTARSCRVCVGSGSDGSGVVVEKGEEDCNIVASLGESWV